MMNSFFGAYLALILITAVYDGNSKAKLIAPTISKSDNLDLATRKSLDYNMKKVDTIRKAEETVQRYSTVDLNEYLPIKQDIKYFMNYDIITGGLKIQFNYKNLVITDTQASENKLTINLSRSF